MVLRCGITVLLYLAVVPGSAHGWAVPEYRVLVIGKRVRAGQTMWEGHCEH